MEYVQHYSDVAETFREKLFEAGCEIGKDLATFLAGLFLNSVGSSLNLLRLPTCATQRHHLQLTQ